MRKIIIVFFSIITVLFLSGSVMAQDKPKVKMTALKQKNDLVSISLTSSKPFIFGSNTYVLYIGNRDFKRNKQWHNNGKGYMTFLVPVEDFNSVQDGADVYITYGKVNVNNEDMSQLSQDSRKCWSLGKLNKNLLKK